ncbi:Diadenosine hexaphosphate hydrolase [Nonomuraea coxensis DSM 45129]|uniref:Diadenosine hexaphosphate hydrolase n=1 Tax=Nonomuraea coxensis DSM 45129 TaxID=1122611 RepID=A0ABX8UE31_9ACTN|nr:NUDIX hydrolase [Nonomuraea coxensis]QYC45069.1 Diadenosine hexaphosphate hydrolase [Nonomuraea coxensis DSM 45129]
MTTEVLRAAGAVVWRGPASRPEVVVIHRPAYGDWTLPKGKLEPGEHVVAAALREVREETGLMVTLGRPLPPAHYLVRGRLKRVDYWAARVTADDGFTPGEEVDELRWLPLEEAGALLTYGWDAELLRHLTAAPLETVPLVLVRHATAGSRAEWDGDDERRPLDAGGRAQAAVLATALPAYRPELLMSSPSARCVQTLEPYGGEILLDPLLSEEGQDPRKTPVLVRELTVPAAVCSHGKVLPGLIQALTGKEISLRKGAFAVVHRVGDRVVAVERHPVTAASPPP